MPKIQIQCENCSSRLAVPDSAAGKKIRCPKCQGVILVTVNDVRPVPQRNQDSTAADTKRKTHGEDSRSSDRKNQRQQANAAEKPSKINASAPPTSSSKDAPSRKPPIKENTEEHREPSHNPDSGVTVLVISIIGLWVPFLLPLAWIMGNSYLEESAKRGLDPGSNGKIGRVIGKIGTYFVVITVGALTTIFVFVLLLLPNLIGQQQGAMEKTTMATIKNIEKNPVGFWAADHDGTYFKGNGNEAWQAMMNPGTYKGRKLRPLIPEPPPDSWGHVLQYEWNGDGHSKKQGALSPAVWSIGANGQDEGGSGDDINNWTSIVADDEWTSMVADDKRSETKERDLVASDPVIGELTEDERKALSGNVLTVLIDDYQYMIELPGTPDSTFRPTELSRIVELAALAKGDSDGIKVRVLIRQSARGSAEKQLQADLEHSGIHRDEILMTSEFVP